MSDNVRIGDSRLVFGVTDEPFGYVQAKTHEKAVSKQEAPNGKGNTVAVEYFNKQDGISGTFTYFTGVDSPFEHVGDGTTITLADVGIAIYIEGATKNWTQGDWSQIDFEGRWYPCLSDS